MTRGLKTPIPVYVTRKTAHGVTGDITMSVWTLMVVLLLAWFNAVAWGCLGLYIAARHIL